METTPAIQSMKCRFHDWVHWLGKLFQFKTILIKILIIEHKIKTRTEIDG
jgi:hypothetical protein